MYIDLEPGNFLEFAAYISDFSKYIYTQCSEINAFTLRSGENMDAEDVAQIRSITQDIAGILERTELTLEKLSGQVEKYAKVVAYLKMLDK